MACGTLLYNEIIVIKYWGFDQNTKAAIKERKATEARVAGHKEEEAPYIATSPHAAYDVNRNKRNL